MRAALLTTLGFAVALGVVWCIVGLAVPLTGPDAAGWLPVAMIVAAVAGFLAVLLRLTPATPALAGILLPAVGGCAGFLVAGGVLHGLGGGNPLAGPAFALSQFGYPGIYVVAALSLAAAAAFRMGTSPHRGRHGRPLG